MDKNKILINENNKKLVLEICERKPKLVLYNYLLTHSIDIEFLNKLVQNNFIGNTISFWNNKNIKWSVELIEKLKKDFNWNLEKDYLLTSKDSLNSTFDDLILHE